MYGITKIQPMGLPIVSQFAVTFGAWLILSLVSVNLIGILTRFFLTNLEMDRIAREGGDLTKKIIKEEKRRPTFLALVLIVVFLAALSYYWNFGVVIVALIIMAARIPDLLWEIRHGKSKKAPPIYMLTSAADWASLPMLWYAIYKM